MNIDDLRDRASELGEENLIGSQECLPEDLGLDRRSGYRFRVNVDEMYIAVTKSEDRTLQYYGGFEYVDKEKRVELGEYVFYYSDGEDRISDCIDVFDGESKEN